MSVCKKGINQVRLNGLYNWFHFVDRVLVLSITRRDRQFSHLPDKEINVTLKNHCQESLDFSDSQHICNADFLREDNVRAILQSIDSYFVKKNEN